MHAFRDGTTMKQRWWRSWVVLACVVLAACASPVPYRTVMEDGVIECGIDASTTDERCFARTPEIASGPGYTLHFVEFDDQGWLYPGPGDKGYVDRFGDAHAQLDRAVSDVALRLANDERVLLLVFVHGWKHGAAHDDRDVMRFRKMLFDAALFDSLSSGADTASSATRRSIVGIYVGWRGAGRLSRTHPFIHFTFWTRKNAALHISQGAARELFARLRGLRERWNTDDASRPRLRTVVIGHSFGGWIAFSALSPSILELLAHRLEIDVAAEPGRAATTFRRARLRSAADIVILINPAFEATRYQPIHSLAQRVGKRLSEYEPPTLLLVTSTADAATGKAFPVGRFFNTLFQRPFVSAGEEYAARRTPGFVDEYITHDLRGGMPEPRSCEGWRSGDATEDEEARLDRMRRNAVYERRRHDEWQAYLAGTNLALPGGWQWRYCGGSAIHHRAGAASDGAARRSPASHSPVWNVRTDGALIPDHSDITGEALHAFFRQLYLDLPQ